MYQHEVDCCDLPLFLALRLSLFSFKAGGNQVERILSRTVGGRVILDLDVGKMLRSDPKRTQVMVDDGTPMVGS